jgi:hypothetical protein
MFRVAGGLLLVLGAGSSLGWLFLMQTPLSSARPAGEQERQGEGFAADRDNGFDAARAMRYLADICKIGPRISGTEGMKKQQALLENHFRALKGEVEFQRFTAKQKSQRQPVALANVIVRWRPERDRRIILCSHYDTRPIADQEPDRRKWREPFISANDGGSGVALLMELGHRAAAIQTPVGIDFVFFDGEEYIFNPGAGNDLYFFGSEHFAKTYLQTRPRHRYEAAILLDMIGGQNAQFPVEQNSWFKAGALVQQFWQVAYREKCAAFQNALGPEVLDDHLALNKAGIPAIDLIDFNYPHWHRLSDVPANCSGESIAQVARAIIAWLEQIK